MNKWMLSTCFLLGGFIIGQTTKCLTPLNRSQAIYRVVCQDLKERNGVYCQVHYSPGRSGPYKLNYDFDSQSNVVVLRGELITDARPGRPITEVAFSTLGSGDRNVKVRFVNLDGVVRDAEWVTVR